MILNNKLLPMVRGGAGRIGSFWTQDRLDAFMATNQLPMKLPEAMNVVEAIELCGLFPHVRSEALQPDGYGLAPAGFKMGCPDGVYIKLNSKNRRDAYGRPLSEYPIGQLGCLWMARKGERVVLRLWFRNPDLTTSDAMLSAKVTGPVDVWSDQIESVCVPSMMARTFVAPHALPSQPWYVIRLDAKEEYDG